MSTVLANPVEMIRQGAPHLIHSDEELEIYTECLFDLTGQVNRSLEDQEAIDLLTLLVRNMNRKNTQSLKLILFRSYVFSWNSMGWPRRILPKISEAKATSPSFFPGNDS